MNTDAEMPCGNCDMGVYSESAMLNRKAREFSVLSTAEREASMPKCKKHDRLCVGARHFSNAISQIDGEIPIDKVVNVPIKKSLRNR